MTARVVRSVRTTAWVAVGAIVAATVALLGIVAAGWSPRVPYVLALAVAGAVSVAAVWRVAAAVSPPTWPLLESPTVERAGLDPRVATIETALRRGVQDETECRLRVQPMLFDLATHRLRHNRGIDLLEQPDRARVALGDDAFRFITDVVSEPVSPAVLSRTVAAIEQL